MPTLLKNSYNLIKIYKEFKTQQKNFEILTDKLDSKMKKIIKITFQKFGGYLDILENYDIQEKKQDIQKFRTHIRNIRWTFVVISATFVVISATFVGL